MIQQEEIRKILKKVLNTSQDVISKNALYVQVPTICEEDFGARQLRIIKTILYSQECAILKQTLNAQKAPILKRILHVSKSTSFKNALNVHDSAILKKIIRAIKWQIKRNRPRHVRRLKTIRLRQVLDSLSDFVNDFKEYRQEEKLPTPQADLGIGPVKYQIKFPAGMRINTRAVARINRLVQQEKIAGDLLLKMHLRLICMLHGREDPLKWVPAAFRAKIRMDITR